MTALGKNGRGETRAQSADQGEPHKISSLHANGLFLNQRAYFEDKGRCPPFADFSRRWPEGGYLARHLHFYTCFGQRRLKRARRHIRLPKTPTSQGLCLRKGFLPVPERKFPSGVFFMPVFGRPNRTDLNCREALLEFFYERPLRKSCGVTT